MIKKIIDDPRSYLFLFLSTYTIYALNYSGYARTWKDLAVTASTFILVDFLLARYYKKANFFPASAFVSFFGIFMMCDSPYLWMYALLAALGAASKHFITNGTKHIFNPNNFGLVMGMLFFEDKMTVIGGRWGGQPWLVFLIIILGIILIMKAEKTPIVIAFVFSFLLFAIIRSQILHASITWVFMPLTGPAFFIFTFYMLTDPKTTPHSVSGQIVFAFLLAMIDALFRLNQNKYAMFLSLFIMCGIFPSLSIMYQWLVSKIRLKNPVGQVNPSVE